MERDEVNKKLNLLGLSESQYESIFVHQLKNHEPVEDAQNAVSFGVEIARKPYLSGESYWGPDGYVEEEPKMHVDFVRITETGDFLEKMKRLAFGFRRV